MSQLRISSGTAKNKKLLVPNIPDFRPAQEVVKQAIFSIIGDRIKDATCLDLFAGSGNLGLEALSRGASWVDFVDSEYDSAETIEKNLLSTGFVGQGEVFMREAVKFATNAATEGKKYDFIFMDPFYADTAHTHLLKQIPLILKPGGLAVILYGKQLNLDTIVDADSLTVVTSRRFGASYFSVLALAKS